eukprot:12234958-Ditylum_brightwellii.AAC.1
MQCLHTSERDNCWHGQRQEGKNMIMSDKNSKSVVDAPNVLVTPTNATATAPTAGASPQIRF